MQHRQQLYHLEADSSQIEIGKARTRVAYIDGDITDMSGAPIDYFKVDRSLEVTQASVSTRGALPDRLFAPFGGWLVVSGECYDVFRNVKCCPSISWLPMSISRKGGEHIADYHLAYGAREHQIWDLRRSQCDWADGIDPGETVLISVKIGVIDPQQVPNLDLFVAEGSGWIATEELRDSIDQRQLTGFEFRPVGGKHPIWRDR